MAVGHTMSKEIVTFKRNTNKEPDVIELGGWRDEATKRKNRKAKKTRKRKKR
jgi:hypothetical protein